MVMVLTSSVLAVTAIKKHFTESWGKKCNEFEPECPACIAWKFYEGAGEEYLSDLIQQHTEAAYKKGYIDAGIKEITK